MPRFLLCDRPELWRRVEHSALRREDVDLVLVRDRSELTRRARAEAFDGVLVETGSDEAREVREALVRGASAGPPPRVVEWGSGTAEGEIARQLGLESRCRPRCGRRLLVETERFSVHTKDLSSAGVFLIDAPELPVGSRLPATLRWRRGGRAARAQLVIVRRVATGEPSHRLRGVAARLEAASAEDAALLERWAAAEEM